MYHQIRIYIVLNCIKGCRAMCLDFFRQIKE